MKRSYAQILCRISIKIFEEIDLRWSFRQPSDDYGCVPMPIQLARVCDDIVEERMYGTDLNCSWVNTEGKHGWSCHTHFYRSDNAAWNIVMLQSVWKSSAACKVSPSSSFLHACTDVTIGFPFWTNNIDFLILSPRPHYTHTWSNRILLQYAILLAPWISFTHALNFILLLLHHMQWHPSAFI